MRIPFLGSGSPANGRTNSRTEQRRSRRPLVCETLDARRLLAGDPIPEVEPNDSESTATAFQLAANDSVRLIGTSQSQDDKDFFAFTAPVDMQVMASMVSSGGAKLEIENASGNEVLETEPKDQVNSGSWMARAGERYVLRLRAPSKSAAEYELTLTSGSQGNVGNGTENPNNGSSGAVSPGPEVEPNDRPGQATRVQLAATSQLTLSGSVTKKDRDFFQIESASAGTVTVDTGTSGVKVSIESTSGVKRFESEPNDGVTTGTFAIAAGEVVILRARGVALQASDYSIKLSLNTDPATSASNTNPSASTSSSKTRVSDAWCDASNDGQVTALDALLVINYLNRHSHSSIDDAVVSLDTNDDRVVTALDALLIINRINSKSSSIRTSSSSAASVSDHAGLDDHGVENSVADDHGVDKNDAVDDSDMRRRKTT